jgi:cell division transport system permease protein
MLLIKRAIKNAVKGLLRHRGLTLATILVMSLTLGATSGFGLFAFGAETVIDYYESRPLVTAFFTDEATEEEILSLRDEILSRPEVAEVVYTSKDEAFSIYSEQFADRPELLESIPTNILPASLDVRTENLDDLPGIAEFFEGSELVEEVSFYQDVIERFKNLVTVARYGLLSLTAVFAFISVVVVLSTIGLIIYSMSEEIEIMALLGASPMYIRLPFIIQGMICGLVAAIISGGLLAGAVLLVFPYARSFFSNVPLPDPSLTFQLQLAGIEVVFGIILGSLGSLIAVKRYLKF